MTISTPIARQKDFPTNCSGFGRRLLIWQGPGSSGHPVPTPSRFKRSQHGASYSVTNSRSGKSTQFAL